tara:strand:- start:92 stop:226 length:135 start_codon:yes stop_codon:yes gene_type:complete
LDYEGGDFKWFYGASNTEFTDMVDYGMVLGTSFSVDGSDGRGGG